MRKNMGTTDSMIRVAVAAGICILYITNQISGSVAIILGILALVMILTSFVRVCPLYLPFGISTVKKT